MTPRTYAGRLEFNPDTGFHEDGKGAAVVTKDGGKTWVYAEEDETSHFDRYHENFATVDGTAQTLLNLQLEHGREKAEEIMRKEHPHHFEVQSGDDHFQKGAKDDGGNVTHTRTRSIPDEKAAKVTSHTEAWK